MIVELTNKTKTKIKNRPVAPLNMTWLEGSKNSAENDILQRKMKYRNLKASKVFFVCVCVKSFKSSPDIRTIRLAL